MAKIFQVAALLILAAASASARRERGDYSSTKTVYKTAVDNGLTGTVFAPTDTAFTNLFAVLGLTPQQVLANTALITAVMQYHVVPGEDFKTTDVSAPFPWISNDEFNTLLGQRVTVAVPEAPDVARVYYGPVTLTSTGFTATGRALVETANIKAGKAVIHTISRVLLPALA